MNLLDLNDIFGSIWTKLETAVRSRHEAWHLVTLATLRDNKPEIRTLVLRGASKENRLLWMHTDLRSPKCQDLLRNPEGALLLYDPNDRWQLRLNGTLSFDPESQETDQVWQRTSASAKRCYQGSLVPSSKSVAWTSNLPPSSASSDLGRENFTRLLFQVSKIDWLFLRADGHQRARWTWEEEQFLGSWVVP